MKTLDRITAEVIMDRLKEFRGNQTQASKSLKISIRTIRNWLNKIRLSHSDLLNPEQVTPRPIKTKRERSEEDLAIFPSNEERIAYRDEMINRNYL